MDDVIRAGNDEQPLYTTAAGYARKRQFIQTPEKNAYEKEPGASCEKKTRSQRTGVPTSLAGVACHHGYGAQS